MPALLSKQVLTGETRLGDCYENLLWDYSTGKQVCYSQATSPQLDLKGKSCLRIAKVGEFSDVSVCKGVPIFAAGFRDCLLVFNNVNQLEQFFFLTFNI